MENNNLPEMTDEQRKAALERSAEARRERMEFKELVKKGEISLADALADDRAKRIRVHEFLMCIPGIGKAKADDIMRKRKNKMTDERYREILPVAYMTAAIVKGRQPRPVEVGLCARAIVDAEDENNLAYRVAMATKIHCTIVGVKRVPTKANSDKYEITYRTLGRDEDEMIPSPLLNGFPLGKVAEWLWGRKNDDGTDYWVGRRAVLYKHNDPPKEGDMSSAGYRCCVFAEALDK